MTQHRRNKTNLVMSELSWEKTQVYLQEPFNSSVASFGFTPKTSGIELWIDA